MQENKLPLITERTNLKGTYVFVRVSLNVPVQDGVVLNEFRITQSLPTIQYLIEQGARIILCSHLGKDGSQSLFPVCEVLKKYIPVQFSSEVLGETTLTLRNTLQDGEVLLLENVRKDAREMENDMQFAEGLAALADVYVNDDFAASHREHASLHAICALLPSYIGINCAHEVAELSKALAPQSPSLFILGGAKFETKMPLVEKFLTLYDYIFITGALANDFFKARGLSVGKSLVSDISLVGSPLVRNPKVIVQNDVTVACDGVRRITTPDDVHEDEIILDAGPMTIELLSQYTVNAASILWNGPLGNYEAGFTEQTLACAKLVAASPAYSVVGGGDTVASIEALDNQDEYDFLSTAGGAMLTFLELGSLPALDAIGLQQ